MTAGTVEFTVKITNETRAEEYLSLHPGASKRGPWITRVILNGPGLAEAIAEAREFKVDGVLINKYVYDL